MRWGPPSLWIVLLFILGTLAAGILVAAGPQMAAAHDVPVINGSTPTYSGNQQPDALPQNQTSIHDIVVNNLTTNAGPQDTSISLTKTAQEGSDHGDPGGNSQALSMRFDGGSFSLKGNNYGAYLNTTAGNGHSGKGGTGGEGKNARQRLAEAHPRPASDAPRASKKIKKGKIKPDAVSGTKPFTLTCPHGSYWYSGLKPPSFYLASNPLSSDKLLHI